MYVDGSPETSAARVGAAYWSAGLPPRYLLGGEPVLDGDDDSADLGAQHGRGGVLPGDVAEDHAAAVDEVDAREGPRGVDRPVDPNGDVRVAVGTGDGAVLLGDVGVLHDREHREDLLDGRGGTWTLIGSGGGRGGSRWVIAPG
jgi:hypothetical protein